MRRYLPLAVLLCCALGVSAALFHSPLRHWVLSLGAGAADGVLPASQYAAIKPALVDLSEVTYENAPALALTFSVPLQAAKPFSTFIRLSTGDNTPVRGEWILAKNGLTAYFQAIEPNTAYKLTLEAPLPFITGAVLGEKINPPDIRTRPLQPLLEFASQGSVLPIELNQGLPVTTVNVEQAHVDFFRLDDKAVPTFIANGLRNTYADDLPNAKTLVYSGRFDLHPPKNTRHVTNLPVGDIAALRRQPGVYLAVLQRPGEYSTHSITWFVISDIGVHLRVHQDQLRVFVNSLAHATPLANAQVRLLRNDGAEIQAQATNDDGFAAFDGVTTEAETLLVSHNNEIAVLNLRGPALDLSGLNLPASREPHPLNAFIYTPRDLYRPGETLDFSVLLRDGDGQMAASPALTARMLKPNGDVADTLNLTGNALAYYSHSYQLPKEAATGLWRIEILVGEQVLDGYPIHVEEFIPERMKLSLGGGPSPDKVSVNTPITFQVEGQYLYGAAAEGNRLVTKMTVKPLRNPFPQWAGFEFGQAVTEDAVQHLDVPDITLDEAGKGTVELPREGLSDAYPQTLEAQCSLEESGGRAVTRTRNFTLWPSAGTALGIRLEGDPKRIRYNSLVEFSLIAVNAEGEKQQAKGLEVTLVRKRRDYYWTRDNNGQYQYSEKAYTTYSANLDTSAAAPTTLRVPVEYGLYQLEVRDPATGATSVYPFSANYGWYSSMDANSIASRPDDVTLLLDKPAYQQGDKVKLQVRAPYDGEAIILLEGDRLLWQKRVTLRNHLATVEVPLNPLWQQHHLYLSALVLSPGNSNKKIPPQRGVGVVHVPLDRSARQLQLGLTLPAAKVRPESDITVNIKVANAPAGPPVMVSLAAVDEGVLSVTDFKTPNPFAWFFAPRRYLMEMRDIYSNIINNLNDATAQLRFGGSDDAAGGVHPTTDVTIVSLFKQPVTLNEQGEASIPVHLPDFNGRLRFMAVAFSDEAFGQAEQDLILAAPLVTQISLPRFLASGDKAEIALDVHNLSGAKQQLDITLQASSPLKLAPYKTHLTLEDQQKHVIRLPLEADMAFGTGTLSAFITNNSPADAPLFLEKHWNLGVRPPFPAVAKTQFSRLGKGETFNLTPPSDNLVPASTRISLNASATPPLNLQSHIHGLLTYPYGCLEQTTSSTFPWLYATKDTVARLQLGDIFSSSKPGLTLDNRDQMLQNGLSRLAGFQLPNGGFGYWGPSNESEWTSVYVADFLLDARDMGVPVNPALLDNLLNRLTQYVNRPGSLSSAYWYEDPGYYTFAFRAYAGYVLSRVNRAPLGSLRELLEQGQNNTRQPLPLMHLGVALLNQGDKKRGQEAIEAALAFKPEKALFSYHFYGDYSTLRRDYAWMVAMAEKAQLSNDIRANLLEKLLGVLGESNDTSTQEQTALLRAAAALTQSTAQWSATLLQNNHATELAQTKAYSAALDFATAKRPLSLTNTSATPLYISSAVRGYPITAPPEERNGFTLERSYFTRDDQPLTLNTLKSGEYVKVKVRVSADIRIADALVVELLPAGFELENQNLLHSVKTTDAPEEDSENADEGYSEPEDTNAQRIKHVEYRDDRFIAAVDVGPDEYERSPVVELTYLMRAVTSGTFTVPNPFVEAMNRPSYKAVGAPQPKVTITPR